MAREMKYSGVPWLGNVPSAWKIVRTKNLYKNHKDIAGDSAEDYERLALTLNGVIKRPKDDSTGLQPEAFNSYQILRENELVFKLIDLENVSTSRVGYSPYLGIVSPAYIVLTPRTINESKYGVYYFLSMWQREVFNHMGDDGVRSSLNANDLLNIPYLSIPNDEQQRIVSFLDAECARIDSLVEQTRASIEEYKKLKQAIITEAVTKGIRPGRKMKDSGIEWIGEIPAEWEVNRIGLLYVERKEKVSDYDFPPLSVTKLGILPQLSTAAKTDAHDDRKLVRKGDFAINSRSDRRGSCGISSYDGSVSLINTILTPRLEMHPVYYEWLFHSTLFSDEFYKWGHGIVDDLWTTNWQDMKRIYVPIPPYPEQADIAEYLNFKCSEIADLISTKDNVISELETYKKSLIYEYVTGKKEVPA
ncbi:MAG: restriction endonuclease subunit S [Thermoguttaceae bacterium]|nr:restriction endonuclease subunit S [Thermoguttaceae bacterium]